jgi:membrane-bound lytic murein transglycosylase B
MAHLQNISKHIILALLFITLLVSRPVFSQSEEIQANTEARQALEEELKSIESQINELETQLSTTKGEKKTLANKISQLRKEGDKLRLQIKSSNIKIADLENKLANTAKSIKNNQTKIAELRGDLAEMIRLVQQRDRDFFLLRLFIEGGLSKAFVEANNYQRLSISINNVVQESKKLQRQLAEKQVAYEAQQDDAEKLLAIAKLQQSSLGGKLSEQNNLLEQTKGLELTYQNLLQDNKKRAAQIRSRIYELLGVGTQITFGQAVTIAQATSKQTGVSAAFLLAILTQESNLGKNVGTCNRPGDPPEKGWKTIMKPTRDQEPFLAITTELGRDPDVTPVSCPMRNKDGSQLGWGGAMGPAQFIPSTWMGYKDKVSKLTGKSPADPWDIRDAFMAAALLLKNNGANGTYDGEWKAAMRYFSGGTDTRYRFYGDNVMKLAEKYTHDIADLEG